MKQVKSKDTGHIGELDFDSQEGVFIVVCYDLDTKVLSKDYYKNIEDLAEKWEDYEEPEEYYFIRNDGSNVGYSPLADSVVAIRRKQIGNYFETKEEAEKAVEKLKAWQRLKDKGFFFDDWKSKHDNTIMIRARIGVDFTCDVEDDLDLLFGGKE